ncbi:hypothetical protein [Dorea sp.]
MKNPYELANNILQFVNDKKVSESREGRFTSIDLYGTAVNGKCGEEKDYD